MLGLIGDWYRARRAEYGARAAHARAEAMLAEGISGLNPSNFYYDLDKLQLAGLEAHLQSLPRTASASSYRDMRAKVALVMQSNAHARNLRNTIVNFTVGAGFALKIDDDKARDRWWELSRAMRWARRKIEIVRRVVDEGETIIRRYDGDAYRFVECDCVENPGKAPNGHRTAGGPGAEDELEWHGGVATMPGDTENVIAYSIGDEIVPAADVFHFKQPETSLADTRAAPPFYDMIPDLMAYSEWLRYRRILNQVRTSLAFIRKHKGASASGVTAFADSVKSGNFDKADGTLGKYKQMMPGAGIDITDDIELDFPPSNIDSRGAAADGRCLRLLIALWLSLPEYMATGDASNANFSSTMVAENPGMKALQAWQLYVGDEFARFVQWVLGDPDLSITFTWPSMFVRDALDDAKANELMHSAGVMSDVTWQERANLDPDTERERLAAQGGLENNDDGE